jgi:hypothetical protein
MQHLIQYSKQLRHTEKQLALAEGMQIQRIQIRLQLTMWHRGLSLMTRQTH